MSSVLKFFKSDKKKKGGQYLEISEIGMPTQVPTVFHVLFLYQPICLYGYISLSLSLSLSVFLSFSVLSLPLLSFLLSSLFLYQILQLDKWQISGIAQFFRAREPGRQYCRHPGAVAQAPSAHDYGRGGREPGERGEGQTDSQVDRHATKECKPDFYADELVAGRECGTLVKFIAHLWRGVC